MVMYYKHITTIVNKFKESKENDKHLSFMVILYVLGLSKYFSVLLGSINVLLSIIKTLLGKIFSKPKSGTQGQ